MKVDINKEDRKIEPPAERTIDLMPMRGVRLVLSIVLGRFGYGRSSCADGGTARPLIHSAMLTYRLVIQARSDPRLEKRLHQHVETALGAFLNELSGASAEELSLRWSEHRELMSLKELGAYLWTAMRAPDPWFRPLERRFLYELGALPGLIVFEPTREKTRTFAAA
ncbi:MAG: hypothetical protein AAF355_15610 [Myxococcota bacterium]